MKLYDFSYDSPAENLACDEALLDWCEEQDGEDLLRFWESPNYFVVVGYANKIATEVDIAHCEAKKIPVFRRCSGGGTVLQGPGCLNYALVLRITNNSPLANITSANQWIMERNRAAMEDLFGRARHSVRAAMDAEANVGQRSARPAISVRGHTDLAFNSQLSTLNKFSGNSQRRRKHFLLFHGAFLLDFDLKLISECLKMPSKQPAYRGDRSHKDFLTNLNLPADPVKAALRKTWNATAPLKNPPLKNISALAREKYSTREWNWKF